VDSDSAAGRSHLHQFSWLGVAFTISAIALLVQLFPYYRPLLTGMCRGIGRFLGAVLLAFDVRYWHWTWRVYSVIVNASGSLFGSLNPFNWGWATFAVLSGFAIVALISWKAWANRNM